MKNFTSIKLSTRILGLGLLLAATSFANDGVKPLANAKTKMHEWLMNNTVYPVSAANNKEEGTVYISFTVSETGQVQNVELAKGVSTSLNNEALSVVEQMPVDQLISGSENYGGYYIVPIKFVIK